MIVRLGARANAMLFVLLLSPLAASQLHKDEVRGFQFKPPHKFASVALSPTERVVVAKYQSEQTEASAAGNFRQLLELQFLPKAAPWAQSQVGGEDDEFTADHYVDVLLDTAYADCKVDKDRSTTVAHGHCRELYLVPDNYPLSTYCAVIEQDDGLFVFEGKALTPRFDKAARDFSRAMRSFKRIDKIDTSAHDAELSQMDEQDRFLQKQIDKLPPGWDHMKTDRYLFLFDADKNFVKELADRIEAMRDEYERLYPPDHPIDAISIVRVCQNEAEYHAYGGPSGSAGYWYDRDQELVFYDANPRTDTLLVCNHEAFHQYIYYFYGNLAPHPWYNEGHGDYFSGAKLTRSNRITGYGNFQWRYSTIKEAARLRREGKGKRDGACAPLKELMHFHHGEYYGSSGWNIGINYAAGWALVHMLRESKKLEPKWEKILPDYLHNLLAARDEVAKELMDKEIKLAERNEEGSSDDMSKDPKDYYAKVDTEKVQDRAYDMTFSDWTDDDWAAFDDFYLEYVEKL